MTGQDDHELLAEFARNESEEAFAALAARYVNLVYSAAWRFTGNPHHAEEITQAVFIILARKAAKLSPRTVLSGWLYQTARLTAANFVKGEIRRQYREQEAYMQSTLTEPPDAAAWNRIAPLLDEAMGQLGETDRNALVLRFFENRTAREAGAALKLTEAAAHKRVNRALEKLRKYFVKRGVHSTAETIAGAISAHSVQAAPVALAKSVTAVAMVKGSIAAASTLTLVKGTMKMMTWMKLKFAAGVGVMALLAGGVVTVAISQTSGGGRTTAQEIAKQSQDAYAALSSYSDTGRTVSEVGGQTITTTFNIRLQRPNLYRVEWTQATAYFTNGGVVWSDGSGDFLVMGAAGQEAKVQPWKEQNMQMALASATGVSAQAAATIPGTFFNQHGGDVLNAAASGRSQVKEESDGKVGDIDCSVISSVIDPATLPNHGQLPNNTGADEPGKVGTVTTTFWIGKRDHLIHQTRTVMEHATINIPPASDSDLKTILERQNKPATPEAIDALRTELETANEQAQNVFKSGKIVFTQTHENIVVNPNLSAADFAR